MVFTEQQLQVKKLVDVQQDIEIDALNDGVGALSSTMQNGFTEAANNFSDIQNSLGLMNSLSDERYNGLTGSVNALSNAMTQGFLDIGNTVANVAGEIQGQLNQMNANTGNMNDSIQNQFNDVNNYVGGFENNVNTALQGIQNTFYGMENDYLDRFNQVNANIGDSINNFNEQIRNELSVNVFSADTMIYNVSATPVSSLTALGYDSNGKIIPVTVIANQNVVLPENANYLYTDAVGTPYKGKADTVVSTNENLVTSHAVYNAVNDIMADINEFHNEVSNTFGDVQNSFNAVDSTFAGVQNQFNDVNNAHNTLYQNVVDGFIDVWANFDSVNNNISNIQNQFNDVNNSINNMNDDINYIWGYRLFHTIPSIKNIPDFNNVTHFSGGGAVGGDTINTIPTFASPYLVAKWSSYKAESWQNHLDIECPKIGGGFAEGLFEGHSKIMYAVRMPAFNGVARNMFRNSSFMDFGLNTLSGATDISNICRDAVKLRLLNYVRDVDLGFFRNMTNMAYAFCNCTNLNGQYFLDGQYILKEGVNLQSAFQGCTNFTINQIVLPNNSDCRNAFRDCTNLNGDVYCYYIDSTYYLVNAFLNCGKLNSRNIHIPSRIPMDTSNTVYNFFANGRTGVNWTGRIYNDL